MEVVKKTGRPKGSRDRNNIFLNEKDTEIILKSMINNSDRNDEDFEKTFTKISSLAISLFGSSRYLRIVGQ